MESIPDLAWGILLKKGIQDRYETYPSDAMPKPKKQYLFPVFDQETWDAMIQAILEAAEESSKNGLVRADFYGSDTLNSPEMNDFWSSLLWIAFNR